MNFVGHGLNSGPVLVCLPGLIGGPEDFRDIIVDLKDHFQIMILDPNSERRVQVGLNLTPEAMREISYDSTSDGIRDVLFQHAPGQKYFFLGISLGGKVVYDFAIKYPELIQGGVITDVGLSPFGDSELFKVIEGIVDHTDLSLPWAEIKKSLQDTIPDKNLRILIQTQITYPDKKPPAVWKTGMKNFENLLKRQTLDLQVEGYQQVDQQLFRENKSLFVMHASAISGISAQGYAAMKKMKSIKIVEIAHSTHLLHVTHKDEISKLALGML
ncbi:MAG TPA: alpha/beta hydrolase [Bacteriovoracaceae bacterium]|nr:alpha/beta hydrolase [Bacteriovoracaceae bacterium]